MHNLTYRLFRDEHAQDLIEYALLSACLAVFCIVGILEVTRIVDFFVVVGAALGAAL